jgi:hypothetical protein
MKRLNEDVLAIGDIILTTSNKLQSKAIRKFTKSDISHAMVYVDHYSVIDATSEGVHARNTQRLFFPEDCSVYALRLKQPISTLETDSICNFVRGRVGTEYSPSEAVATAFGGLNGWSAKQFCSRLVAQAFASVGRALVSDPNFCSPEDLKSSPLLDEVGGATESITDHDVERWDNDADMTQVMRDVTNTLLNGIRKKNKDIQNLNDVDSRLIEHPEDDAYYCELLHKSGYLTLWQPEMRKNPWQYDVEALKATGWPNKHIETYCKRVQETADNGGKRYHLNKAGYLYLMNVYGLKSFQILSSLYEVLADLDMQRFQVAKQWLNAQDSQVKVPDPYVMPHSPEWFAALSAWNPYQAQMARMYVERGGSIEVCSMCGDEPAPVYRIDEGIPPPPGSVATLRLCDDCRQIRARKGENFVPFDR